MLNSRPHKINRLYCYLSFFFFSIGSRLNLYLQFLTDRVNEITDQGIHITDKPMLKRYDIKSFPNLGNYSDYFFQIKI